MVTRFWRRALPSQYRAARASVLRVRPPLGTPPNPTPFPLGYLDPFLNPPLPPDIELRSVQNPNHVLEAAILGQNIVNTVVLQISTVPDGNIGNIPFVVRNANAT